MERQVGIRIKKARQKAGLTGEQLAERCNISTTYLRQMEGGTKTPSIGMLAILCKELDVSPNYLLPDLVPKSEQDNLAYLDKAFSEMTPSQKEMIVEIVRIIAQQLE